MYKVSANKGIKFQIQTSNVWWENSEKL